MIMAKDSHGNYVEIEDIKQQDSFKGISPINFKSNGDNLKNYRIYGNTVNEESVGDRTGNLVNKTKFVYGYRLSNIGTLYTTPSEQNLFAVSEFIEVNSEEQYIISQRDATRGYARRISFYQSKNENSWLSNNDDSDLIFTVPNTATYLRFTTLQNYIDSIMLIRGTSLPTQYEPYGYKVPVVVNGKNLLQNNAISQTVNGVTFTVNNDKSITCNGTATGTAAITINTIFSINSTKISGCPMGGSWSSFELDLLNINTNNVDVMDTGNGAVIQNENSYRVRIRIASGYTCNNLTFYPMIRKADITDDTYEPYHAPVTTPIYLPEQIRKVGDEAEYIDYGEQMEHRLRKNLLQNTATSQTINGVTFTVNDDGSVTCNGTSDAVIQYNINTASLFNITENVILSGCPSSGSSSTFLLRGRYPFDNIISNDNGNGVLIDRIGEQMRVQIRIASGYTCNNLTFYPMIRKASIEDGTYEPYIEDTNVDVTLPALPTLSGTNTLSVNTNIKPSKVWGGLNDPIDIEYVKDNLGNVLFSKYYEIEGEPPLIFKAKRAGNLKNYRIYGNTETLTRSYSGTAPLSFPIVDGAVSNYRVYGNTVNGESVGDKTENIFDKTKANRIYNTARNADGSMNYNPEASNYIDYYIPVKPNTKYIIKGKKTGTVGYVPSRLYFFDVNKVWINRSDLYDNAISTIRFTTPSSCNFIQMQEDKNRQIDFVSFMIVEGSAVPENYIPYGYHIPITNNSETANIYLDEPLTKQGDNADYIDYAEQKRYNTDGTSEDVTLPTLPAQSSTNSLSFGTAIQPSSVAVDVAEVVSCGDKVTDNQSVNYGKYKIPVTLTADSAETTDIYLDEPLAKLGNNADYIDYATQKRHNSDGTESSVTLPEIAVTAGTNTLTVETGVQPSDIYLKGKIEKKPKIYYKIYYYSQDGQTLLYTESVLKGSNGMYSGTPTKMADPQYTYTFAGWSSSTGQTTATPEVRNNIQNDKNVYAAFSQTLNTYTVYFYNESDTPIETVQNVPYGGTATYTGATPTKQGYSFTGWSPLPTNITADTSCYAQFEEDDMYTDTISDSWEEIIANCDNGTYASKYQVGDLKTIDVGSEGPVQMQIVAIDTDLLASDNTKKAPITWISKQLLNTYKAMHNTSSNYLSNWANCDMRTYLRGTILPMLPSVVQNGIKEVTKYTNKRTRSTAWTTVSATENIWLPSYREVSNNTSKCETSGVQYNSIFTSSDTTRVKSKVGNSAYWWWTRSASGNSNSYYSYCFAIVNSGGIATYYGNYCSSSYGVAIGFCT